MKGILAILSGAVVIALILSLGVYYIFGDNPGYFFVRFIAVPAGLAGAGVLFLIYIAVFPKKKTHDPKE